MQKFALLPLLVMALVLAQGLTSLGTAAIVEPIGETLLYGAIDAFEPNAGS